MTAKKEYLKLIDQQVVIIRQNSSDLLDSKWCIL